MGVLVSLFKQRGFIIFLNLSFLSVAACTFFAIRFHSPESHFHVLNKSSRRIHGSPQDDCRSFLGLTDFEAKCSVLKSNNPCNTQGYIDYLYIFYCQYGSFSILGYTLLFLWLLVLFYLLGNTASEYFCSSLESLSKVLNLSPTIAGVTLLSLGNGAPDVFASLVAFMGDGTSDIGLNTVLGGASFVTCVVVGIISILLRRRRVKVNRSGFIRDVLFFLLVLLSVFFILLHGHINLWGAIGFSSMYIVYVLAVYVSHAQWLSFRSDICEPLLKEPPKDEFEDVNESRYTDDDHDNDNDDVRIDVYDLCFCPRLSPSCLVFLRILEIPLYLPRRLTIPAIAEENWSRPYAVASVILAPLLLSVLWTFHHQTETTQSNLIICVVALLLGISFGIVAFATTENSTPPKKCLFPWLAAGFTMSLTWSYILAQELVGLLVSLGYIMNISPSILGLTFLAWGNSLGDLVANVTMALNGGQRGAQIAISGCYAGPIFNTLFGLGMSLIGASWKKYPQSIAIPPDPYVMETLGLLVGGLLWALVALPRREMRLDAVLGGGLLAIYLTSLLLRLLQAFASSH
ncbi:cation/calcium exchanger 2-like [Cucurbita maxima]|uniref:Cation/calcium exchanger 2-like n=1 Tax=Cucurbita maxima TaxID=3661 RepID=A0A6J1J8B9_CUCMA|nr:cation/calcium exchanger 2-like [Cucurbita maxima]